MQPKINKFFFFKKKERTGGMFLDTPILEGLQHSLSLSAYYNP